MITAAAIVFSSAAFVLRLLSYTMYIDPETSPTPIEQDYIFDMMTLSEFLFVFAAFLATYEIPLTSKGKAVLRSVFRIVLFAQLFSTGKELSGINTTNELFEKLLFCLLIITVGYFSFTRIHKWEKTKKLE